MKKKKKSSWFKKKKKKHAKKITTMEMTLVMKSKNVCLLYLPVISRGENRGGEQKDR